MISSDLLLAALCGLGVFILLKKNNASDAQSENLKTKEQLLKLEEEKIKLNSSLQNEETKREELKKEMTDKVNESLTPQDIADYFNRSK